MRRALAILFLLPLLAVAQENPFAWDKLPVPALGKIPLGFRSLVNGTGQPGQWQIVEVELPSALDPTKKIRRKVLTHIGNNTDADHFPALVFNGKEYGDFILKARVRVTGGKTAPVAGVVFAMKDDKNFYVTATRPQREQVLISYFEDGKLQPGMDAKGNARPDGWVDFSLIVRGKLMYLTANGVAYGELTLGEVRPGKIGFWAQADTTCQIMDVTVDKPPTLARQALEDTLRANTDVLSLSLAAVPPGKKATEIVASTDDKEIGKPAPEEVAKVLGGAEPTVSVTGEIARVAAPVRDVNGAIIAIAIVHIKTSAFGSQARYRAHGISIGNKLGERFSSAAKLFE